MNWSVRSTKEGCTTLNYVVHIVILVFTITDMFWFLLLLFLLGVPIGITNSAIGLKICATTARIEKYKSIIKKSRNSIMKKYF